MKHTFLWVLGSLVVECLCSIPFKSPLGGPGAQAYGYPLPWLLDCYNNHPGRSDYENGMHVAWPLIGYNLLLLLFIAIVITVLSMILMRTVEVTRKLRAIPARRHIA